MYGRGGAMESGGGANGRDQVDDEDDDVTSAEESINNPQIRFEDGGCVAAMNGIQDVSSIVLYVSSFDYPHVAKNGGSDQLTLSFQSEVYVFDVVSLDTIWALFYLIKLTCFLGVLVCF